MKNNDSIPPPPLDNNCEMIKKKKKKTNSLRCNIKCILRCEHMLRTVDAASAV